MITPMTKPSKLEHEGDLGREAIADLLDQIAAGLRSGTLDLAAGGESLRLEPAAQMRLELQAKRKGDRQSLAFELRWTAEPRLIIEANTIPEANTITDPGQAPELGPSPESIVAELRLDAELLGSLDKQRLYRLAQLLGLDGRSQMSKAGLARVLAELDHGAQLEHQDLLVVALRLDITDPKALTQDELVERLQAALAAR